MPLSSRRDPNTHLPAPSPTPWGKKKTTLANLHRRGELSLLLLTRVPDPSHVLFWAGSTHYSSIDCVAENKERNVNIHIIFSDIQRGKKNPNLSPNTWDQGQD